jgi:hypothetical protein
MKKISDVFELPIDHKQLELYGAKEKQGISFCEAEEHAAHAINHVDALADALESIINASQLYMEDWSVLDDAKAALAAYRGEA